VKDPFESMTKLSLACWALVCMAAAANAQATPDFTDRADRALLAKLIRAQDTRARSDSDLALLRNSVQAERREVRLFAVRALGRLERADVIDDIAKAFGDSSLDVRLAAIQAIGQAASRQGAPAARAKLLAYLEADRSEIVRGRIAETLGRLNPANADEAGNTARLLARMTLAAADSTRDAPAPTLARVARGFFFLSRRPAARGRFGAGVPERLRRLVAYERTPSRAEVGPALRRDISSLAAAALIASGAALPADVNDILGDPDPAVREKGVAALQTLADTVLAKRLIARAFADTAPIVRYRVVGLYARRFRLSDGCGPLRNAARDTNTHVALAAIDALGACGNDTTSLAVIDSIAGGDISGDDWHRPAHALASLATAARSLARTRIAPFVKSTNPFVRAYAARAARALADTATLRRLARDRDANTRAEAVEALGVVVGHSDDSLYLAALRSNDSQVLIAASKALTGNRRTPVVTALLNTLERVTSLRRETSRDARLALLEAIRRDTDSLSAGRVARYLRDFDPAVATKAGEVLTGWVGNRPRIIPVPPPSVRLMSVDSLLSLADKQVTIEMQDGSKIVLGLLPLDAPTNVARFVRLAQRRYFDGLTFHRVVPFYVVQGGSPRANEYVGDGPFTRDEIGIENRRGTIGVSTRGRDTGDGQIYVNMIDNVQLDPDYTVFAYVISGMEAVDRMQEGALIKQIRVGR
jgi:cyclophilin family peptidyl-prolyl cis-trans isomerase/HEAT repeat protein